MRLRTKQDILEKLAQAALIKHAVSVDTLGRVARLMRRSGLIVRKPQRAVPKLGGGYVKSDPVLAYVSRLDTSGIKVAPSPAKTLTPPAEVRRPLPSAVKKFLMPLGGNSRIQGKGPRGLPSVPSAFRDLRRTFKKLIPGNQRSAEARRRDELFSRSVSLRGLPKTLPKEKLRILQNTLRTAGDRVFTSPGGPYRLLRGVGDSSAGAIKKAPSSVGRRLAQDTMIPALNAGLPNSVSAMRRNPEAQRAINLFALRHELSEREAAKRIRSIEKLRGMRAADYPKFRSHLSPGPMLNDLNIAATLTGPGASSTRNVIRDLRRGELSDLIGVLGTRFKSYRRGGAGYNWLNDAFKTGRRLNSRQIRHLEDLYVQAATSPRRGV